MVILYFFGPDGAGKTTIVRNLAKKFSEKGIKVKISWMRGSHTFASVLAKVLSRFDFFKGSENMYYNISIPRKLRGFWQGLEFLSALPVLFLRYLIPSFLGNWIIADRYSLDLAVWICFTTRDYSFLDRFEAKILTTLAKKTDARFYVKADIKTLKNRTDKLPFPEEQLMLYDKLAKMVGATIIDTSFKSADKALLEVLETIETVNLENK